MSDSVRRVAQAAPRGRARSGRRRACSSGATPAATAPRGRVSGRRNTRDAERSYAHGPEPNRLLRAAAPRLHRWNLWSASRRSCVRTMACCDVTSSPSRCRGSRRRRPSCSPSRTGKRCEGGASDGRARTAARRGGERRGAAGGRTAAASTSAHPGAAAAPVKRPVQRGRCRDPALTPPPRSSDVRWVLAGEGRPEPMAPRRRRPPPGFGCSARATSSSTGGTSRSWSTSRTRHRWRIGPRTSRRSRTCPTSPATR